MRTDLMLAQLCAILVNVNRSKGSRASKAEDFMPNFGRAPRRKQSSAEMKAILRQHANAHNRAVKRG